MADERVQREILPIPDREYPGLISYDAKDPDARFPPMRPLRPPAGAPNVLLVLLDDVGFGASSADVGRDAHDHLIDPTQFLHLVMAKQ
jgi:hypothetical protein